jgi:NAD(P)-dependent dehydrogenase (short-subunit alcohol dehydrogenase family)
VIETNLLGTLWVTQAALPIMREQGSGHILQITSGGGVISWPMNGVYQASKFGIDGMSESLAQEAKHLGIKVTIMQVGHMSDTGLGRTAKSVGALLTAYDPMRASMAQTSGRRGNTPKDLTAKIFKVVDADHPPLRVLIGRPLTDIKNAYEERLKVWEAWENVT